jgi:hypothetical protein
VTRSRSGDGVVALLSANRLLVPFGSSVRRLCEARTVMAALIVLVVTSVAVDSR